MIEKENTREKKMKLKVTYNLIINVINYKRKQQERKNELSI